MNNKSRLNVSKEKLLRKVCQQKDTELERARLFGIQFSRDEKDIRDLDFLEKSYYSFKGQMNLLFDVGVVDQEEYEQIMSYFKDDLREWFIDGILKDMFGISRKESADND